MKTPLLLLLFTGLALMMLNTGCADRGCTDPTASNFDPFAQRNDGSCVYRGCTDPAATNYNSGATENDGTCTYPSPMGEVSFWSSVQCCAIEVSLNGQRVDTIEAFYSIDPGCVNGDGIVRVSRPVGSYIVYARTITGDSSQAYVWEDTIPIQLNECLSYQFRL